MEKKGLNRDSDQYIANFVIIIAIYYIETQKSIFQVSEKNLTNNQVRSKSIVK